MINSSIANDASVQMLDPEVVGGAAQPAARTDRRRRPGRLAVLSQDGLQPQSGGAESCNPSFWWRPAILLTWSKSQADRPLLCNPPRRAADALSKDLSTEGWSQMAGLPHRIAPLPLRRHPGCDHGPPVDLIRSKARVMQCGGYIRRDSTSRCVRRSRIGCDQSHTR